MAETPQGCVQHQSDYKPQAWEAYSLLELGAWVHLLAKRAQHRQSEPKRLKDLHDAQNYLSMMQAKLDAIKAGEPQELGIDEFMRLYRQDPSRLGIKKGD